LGRVFARCPSPPSAADASAGYGGFRPLAGPSFRFVPLLQPATRSGTAGGSFPARRNPSNRGIYLHVEGVCPGAQEKNPRQFPAGGSLAIVSDSRDQKLR
jgi:hypothetical protein